MPIHSVVKEINRINERELELGLNGASWHDEYKDSAYIFAGGLHADLTEGDVITIFSQYVHEVTLYQLIDNNRLCRYGEVMDLNMPRDKETGKPKGFSFLMYEDQRSTILAVDNLNGAIVLGRTLRVDHVKNYKQPKMRNEDGEWAEPEEQSMNAKPEMIEGYLSTVVTLPINPKLTLMQSAKANPNRQCRLVLLLTQRIL